MHINRSDGTRFVRNGFKFDVTEIALKSSRRGRRHLPFAATLNGQFVSKPPILRDDVRMADGQKPLQSLCPAGTGASRVGEDKYGALPSRNRRHDARV
jgi:hypothetical protein